MLGVAGTAGAQQAAAARQTVKDFGTYEAQFQDLGAAMKESGVLAEDDQLFGSSYWDKRDPDPVYNVFPNVGGTGGTGGTGGPT